MRHQLRAVFFDLVGTLIHGRTSIGEQYAAHARASGADPDVPRLDEAFRRAMAAAPRMEFPGRSLSDTTRLEREWWRTLVGRVVREAGLAGVLSGRVFDEYFDRLFDHFTTANAWQTYADAAVSLASLREKGLLTGLITNYDTRVKAVLDAVGLSSLLDSVTIPAVAGSAKPSRGIFAHALAAHGLDASSAVYVGDSLEEDYRGALDAGLGALLLDREGRHRDVPGIARIESLVEIGGMLT